MIDFEDSQWYKDAVIYQTHVKAFFDSNNDGIGDFSGLMQKLDYIQDLGVSAIWLLPFYRSPLRDDGYDIADFRRINDAYGDMGDVRRFVREAHRRGIRVITELVINHTSDQHPWFQRARNAPPGSRYRDYYVWSDTDQKYTDTRIIFLDTEPSNWTWDPVAKAYYWHRFFSHQPDLNFDNPAVLREVVQVMRYWLDIGVDGLRLDAIPYLIERDGTNCENLDETHDILKRIRAELDARYTGKMLLAEANQWPEDTRPYFGDGDECHMAFHFPLMPRMYMAIAQEDRHPITDILRQTPEIPEGCQWAVFLRNHDELTLEMVTENEREYLWNTYASDRRMRINLGIRRRLAPLLDNDRRKIELMNGLLFSMPGTPVVYYGDELGMGDNVFLGDRDGVRTPMQWSPDRNAGFSRANPQALYLPPVMDPIYGFDAVNVEAQHANPSSLLNWTKRTISVRQTHRAFGRGTLTFLYPGNRRILAYLREDGPSILLCVFNLSRNAQAFELDLAGYAGRVPVELLGRTPFPAITDVPYRLTLPGYGFFWFVLTDQGELSALEGGASEPLPEFLTIVYQSGWRAVTDGHQSRDLLRSPLPAYLIGQRWFGAKDSRVDHVEFGFRCILQESGDDALLAELRVTLAGSAQPQSYLIAFAVAWGEDMLALGSPLLRSVLAKVRRGPRVGVLYDAFASDNVFRTMLQLMRARQTREGEGGRLEAVASPAFDALAPPEETSLRRLDVEQSNTSVLIDQQVMLKAIRRLLPGIHPEIEIGRYLTEVAGYRNTPPYLGSIEWIDGEGTRTALAAAFGFVPNQGDGWRYTLDYLDRVLEETRVVVSEEAEVADSERHEMYLAQAGLIGVRTAELHRALAIETDDPAFAPERVTQDDVRQWVDSVSRQAAAAFAELERRRAAIADDLRPDVDALLAARGAIEAQIHACAGLAVDSVKTRLHGDYHLGQILVSHGDFVILDFEGEPARPLEERRAKASPLRDVAGMMRSFDYAAWTCLQRFAETDATGYGLLYEPAMAWRDLAVARFLQGYRGTIDGCPSFPSDPAVTRSLLRLFLLEKALYEICYEAANRPAWIRIPIRGIRSMLDGSGSQEE